MGVEPSYHQLYHKNERIFESYSEMPRVKKFNWKSLGAKRYWADLEEIDDSDHLDVLISAILDKDHPRKVGLAPITKSGGVEFATQFGSEGMFFERVDLSDFDSTTPYEEIARQHVTFPTSGVTDLFAFSTSKGNVEEMLSAWEGEEGLESSYKTTARLLGHPEDAINFHTARNFTQEYDSVYEVACNSEDAAQIQGEPMSIAVGDVHPLMNFLWAYNGWNFLYHYPSSFTSHRSLAIARKNFEYFSRARSSELANKLVSWLDLEWDWSGYHHLSTLKNAYAVGSTTTNVYWEEKHVMSSEVRPQAPGLDRQYETGQYETAPLHNDALH